MAGTRAYIEVDDQQARQFLARIAAFGDAALVAFYRDSGEAMVRSTRERAEREEDPQGVPWVPLSPRYARYKAKKRPGAPKLKFDFHMLGDMLSYQLDGTALLWGTNAQWGATQQFGDPQRGIPAREWLGLSDADAEELLEIVTEHLEAATRGLG